MLASKLLPEQEEQQLQQLDDLHQEQGSTGSKQQTADVRVCFLTAVQPTLQILRAFGSSSWVVACIEQFFGNFGVHLHSLRVVMD